MAETVLVDGLLDFSGGVNSLVPTTVASAQFPTGLKRNQLAWLNNATVRGGGITVRNGWQYLFTVRPGIALYQGGYLYRPFDAFPYLVLSIGGRILKCDLSTFAVTDLMAAGDTNPPNEPQAYFVQGEEFLVIQAGDNTTLPLFWDGQLLRRSNGPTRVLGTTALNFVAPAVGSVVQVTLSSPYQGPLNQVVLINTKQYQVTSGASLQQVVTLTNRGDLPAGKNITAGSSVSLLPPYFASTVGAVTFDGTYWNVAFSPAHTFTLFAPIFVNGVRVFVHSQSDTTHIKVSGLTVGSPEAVQLLNSPAGSRITSAQATSVVGQLQTGFAAPAVGSSVSTKLNVVYSGPLGQPVVIGIDLYEITTAGFSPLPANDILLINLTDTPTTVVVAPTSLTTIPELPAATAMEYYMGRIWYAQGRTYIAGDIVRGPSGSLPYGRRDSILKLTENPLAIGGDGFTIPAEAGNIRALAYISELDTSLGQGLLYVFSAKSIYRLQVPVSRSDWIAANDATQPKQTVVQLNWGTVSDRSVVRHNSDLFYQTLEPGIRSLVLAVRFFQEWGNVPISRNENRILRFNDRALLRFASGIQFDNRLLQAALPIQTPVGVAFQAVVPLDFDLISTLEEKRPPAWEGMQEGLDILQMFEGDFGGLQRAFAVVRSRDDGSIQVWEITDYLKNDINLKGDSRTTWVVEFPALTWDQVFLLKRLVAGELWVDRVYGTVMFKMEYRPDGDACWHFWQQWQICSAKNSCEDVNNPVCYPVKPYAESYRETMALGLPQEECATVMGRPVNVGYQFQCRLTVTGWCRVRGLILKAEQVEKELYKDMVCPGITPQPPLTQVGGVVTPSPGISEQFVPPDFPTQPPISPSAFTITSLGGGAILDPNVDPTVCPPFADVDHPCDDIILNISNGGTDTQPFAVLDWTQPFSFGETVTGLYLERSTDNINWETIAQDELNPQTGGSSFTDPTVPVLFFFYRLTAFNGAVNQFVYNVVSIKRQYTLSAVSGTDPNTQQPVIVLSWDAPVFQ